MHKGGGEFGPSPTHGKTGKDQVVEEKRGTELLILYTLDLKVHFTMWERMKCIQMKISIMQNRYHYIYLTDQKSNKQ